MTARHWKVQTDGDFSDAADWTGGVVPGAADDAILDARGTMAYTVSATSAHTVDIIQLNATATLAITARTFVARNGTGSGKCAGTIAIEAGGSFTVGGTFTDADGKITMGGAAQTAVLTIAVAGATVSGKGRITLGDSATNIIRGVKATSVFTNVDNIISGAGQLGAGKLTIVNEAAGVIKATGAVNALIVDTQGETLINQGLMEGAGTAGLIINSTTIENAGVIEADGKGAHLDLSGVTLRGGTLRTLAGGAINVEGSQDLFDGSAGAITNSGKVVVEAGAYLHVIGTLGGDGAINVDGAGLGLGAGSTLAAGARVVMSDSAANAVQIGAGLFLQNAGTLSGAGHIDGYFHNLAGGVIDATGANALDMAIGHNVSTNAGLIETTGAGGLNFDAYDIARGTLANSGTLKSAGAGAFTFSGGELDNTGVILASGTGGLRLIDCRLYDTTGTIAPLAHLYMDYARITANQISITQGGEVTAVGVAHDLFATKTLINDGQIDIAAGATLGLENKVVGNGTINVTGYLELNLNLPTTFSGGGQVNLSGAGYVDCYRVINVNDTFQGSGGLVGVFTNEAGGVIDADGAGAFSVGSLYNDGLLECTSSGGIDVTLGGLDNRGSVKMTGAGALQIYGQVDNFGVIAASGAGGIRLIGDTINNLGGSIAPLSHLYMKQGDIIGYGSLSIVAGGVLTAGGGLLEASEILLPTIVNQGRIDAGAGSLYFGGRTTVINSGTLEVEGGALGVGAIQGGGAVLLHSGTLAIGLDSTQAVTFTSATGTLDLGDAPNFKASVIGFSRSGGTFLDLEDIEFTGSGQAKFSGNSAGGVLTVSDPFETAIIHLVGDYLGATFVCASDGNAGVLIHISGGAPSRRTVEGSAQDPPLNRADPQVFTAAMASIASHGATAPHVHSPDSHAYSTGSLTLGQPKP